MGNIKTPYCILSVQFFLRLSKNGKKSEIVRLVRSSSQAYFLIIRPKPSSHYDKVASPKTTHLRYFCLPVDSFKSIKVLH